jgi:hypothetical protein
MTMIRSLAIGLVMLGTSSLAAAQTDSTVVPDSLATTSVFRSEMAGIEIQKPKAWHFADLQTVMENRASVKLKDAEFQELVQKMASAPLVVAMKHQEPYDALNPSFQVLVRPAAGLEGKSGVEVMQLVTPALAKAFTDFKVVKPAHAIDVGGRPAGRLVISYSVATQDGREFSSLATLVMIPKGKVLYQIGFSGPPDGPDKLTKEIDEILASVKWLD